VRRSRYLEEPVRSQRGVEPEMSQQRRSKLRYGLARSVMRSAPRLGVRSEAWPAHRVLLSYRSDSREHRQEPEPGTS
jgi:hypothetical protein